MPKQRGKTDNLTFAFQRIDRTISSLNGECFTPKEIREITGVNKTDINQFLVNKTKKGFLERIRRGCYRKVSDGNLTQNLPSAFVATKVWRILCQSDKPLIHREISEMIEEETGLNLYFSIGILLFNWYHRNVLDKIGAKKPYAYQIKPDYKKDRPVSNWRS